MDNRVDETENQARLWDDEEFSEPETEAQEIETLESPSEGPLPLDQAVKAARAATAPEATDDEGSLAARIISLRSTPDPYLVALGAGILAAFFSWKAPPIAWLSVVLGAMALRLSKLRDGRWMPWAGIALGALFTVVNLISGPTEAPPAVAMPDSNAAAVIEADPPDGSLGIRFDHLPDEWNAFDQPPFITTSIIRTPESGNLDSFLYRFDGSTLIAGGYDPNDRYIYAILMRAALNHESISQMYVRLCSLIHPGSQDCLNTFVEENNMFGKSPIDFLGLVHDRTWTFEGNEWNLTISHDVQTIRVSDPLGPD